MIAAGASLAARFLFDVVIGAATDSIGRSRRRAGTSGRRAGESPTMARASSRRHGLDGGFGFSQGGAVVLEDDTAGELDGDRWRRALGEGHHPGLDAGQVVSFDLG